MTTTTEPARSFFGWRVMWRPSSLPYSAGCRFLRAAVFRTRSSNARLAIGLFGRRHHALPAGALAVRQHAGDLPASGLQPSPSQRGLRCLGHCRLGRRAGAWQLFIATIFSGFGWAGTGALAINMMISPWFNR